MVPPEAVKGLRYKNGTWLLYASDPEPMAVSAFRLRKEALEAAAPAQDASLDAAGLSGERGLV